MTEVKSVSGRRLLVCSFNSPPSTVRPNQRRERQEVSHVAVMGHKPEHSITPTWLISTRCHQAVHLKQIYRAAPRRLDSV